MKYLVQKQLAQSIATMQATLADLHVADTISTIAEQPLTPCWLAAN